MFLFVPVVRTHWDDGILMFWKKQKVVIALNLRKIMKYCRIDLLEKMYFVRYALLL